MITEDHAIHECRQTLRLRRVAILRRIEVSADRSLLAAAAIIAVVCLLHLLYLAFACPFDFAPDEAHYWHWSRHLDIAYYSKGPLIAWLIRGSCEIFGSTSFAVRLPAVACHGALLAAVFLLSRNVVRNPGLALAVLALAATLPPLNAGAVLMTIDSPFLACWAWSLVFVHRASERGRTRDWLFAGIACGAGLLAKFPMLLLPAALTLYLLCDRERRSRFRERGVWIFFACVLAASLPIMVWNFRHGWVEVRHVAKQVGGDGLNLLAPFAFLGGQFAFLIGYWFLAFLFAAWKFRPTVSPEAEFLWYFSVPVWCVFLVASTRTPGQVNWPAAAYVAGFPLAVLWVQRQITDPAPRYRRFAQGCLVFGIALGSMLTLMAHFPGTLFRPWLALVAPVPTPDRPLPLRKFDPTCRLEGWTTLAREVDAIRVRVRQEIGQEPVLAGMVWTLPGELSFYCDGHPEAYSFGLALADRHSQYDLWRPNPVADVQVFAGRTFLYVGDEIPGMRDVFERIEPPIRVHHTQNGRTLAAWTIWVGHGFRGFREISHRAGY